MAILNHKLCTKLFSGTTLRRADTKELEDVNNQEVKTGNKPKGAAILTIESTNPFADHATLTKSTNPFEDDDL
jgi:hypothetical protein